MLEEVLHIGSTANSAILFSAYRAFQVCSFRFHLNATCNIAFKCSNIMFSMSAHTGDVDVCLPGAESQSRGVCAHSAYWWETRRGHRTLCQGRATGVLHPVTEAPPPRIFPFLPFLFINDPAIHYDLFHLLIFYSLVFNLIIISLLMLTNLIITV